MKRRRIYGCGYERMLWAVTPALCPSSTTPGQLTGDETGGGSQRATMN